MLDPDDPRGCCFDQWAVDNAARVRKRGFRAPITKRVVRALEQQGLEGRTLLDVGCGVGDLALGAIDRGAARADGIDLSPGGIEQARTLASERGLTDRSSFEIGDGAVVPLNPHDVVALNRVLCCYPKVDRLLGNSLGAARIVYAYSAPESQGMLGRLNRISVAISNRWFRLRAKKFRGFQAFVHDLDAVDRTIARAGFRRVHVSQERVVWRLAVFART
jgi:SAM-dependent methyltransferase